MPTANLTADEALARLKQGNLRFVADDPRRDISNTTRRLELRDQQHPFAVVLTCSDSRVSPSFIFDVALGDLFVVRVAGNVAGDHELGTIEFAAVQLGVRLVIVMGHEACGAVTAAVAGQRTGLHIDHLIDAIAPSVAVARAEEGDLVDRSVRAHARRTAHSIANDPAVLAGLVADDGLTVLPAIYRFDNGEVEWLDPA